MALKAFNALAPQPLGVISSLFTECKEGAQEVGFPLLMQGICNCTGEGKIEMADGFALEHWGNQ
jgi:hypothetical protein